MQKYHKGDLVRIAKKLDQHMSLFEKDCLAIVMGSHANLCLGGEDDESTDAYYELFLRKRGEISWYPERQLTLVASSRLDLLQQWKMELQELLRAERQRNLAQRLEPIPPRNQIAPMPLRPGDKTALVEYEPTAEAPGCRAFLVVVHPDNLDVFLRKHSVELTNQQLNLAKQPKTEFTAVFTFHLDPKQRVLDWVFISPPTSRHAVRIDVSKKHLLPVRVYQSLCIALYV